MTSTDRRAAGSIDRHLYLARLANMVAFCCLPYQSAYSVGAVIADSNGRILGVGYSRQSGPYDHAEEAALRAAKMSRNNLSGAYIYTSLEPCGVRSSKSTSCARLLIEAGIAHVYFTAREPTLFQRQCGLELLTKAGVVCSQLPGFDHQFRHANYHLFQSDQLCE
jgi:pyrimidine deaminase RibD-like protein